MDPALHLFLPVFGQRWNQIVIAIRCSPVVLAWVAWNIPESPTTKSPVATGNVDLARESATRGSRSSSIRAYDEVRN